MNNEILVTGHNEDIKAQEFTKEDFNSIDHQVFTFKNFANGFLETIDEIGKQGFFDSKAVTKEEALKRLKHQATQLAMFLSNLD